MRALKVTVDALRSLLFGDKDSIRSDIPDLQSFLKEKEEPSAGENLAGDAEHGSPDPFTFWLWPY